MTCTFSHLVTRFFISHLTNELGLSENSIASYSDCIRLLINYACTNLELEPEKLSMEIFSRELILDFLDHLQNERGNVCETRNQRLASIKTFFRFLARTVPELMHLNQQIQAIRSKKTTSAPPSSLTLKEVKAIIASPSTDSLIGLRDKAMLQLFYNTGARVQELADLQITDLRTASPPTITLTGKGRKTRTVPLWAESVQLIEHYLQQRKARNCHTDYLFTSNRGQPITRSGISRRVSRHTQTAAKQCPSLQNRHVTPHTFRHTTALHLIEAGNDITVVKDWLGHADLKTTSLYVEVSIERKRAALEKIPSPASPTHQRTDWRKPDILNFLTNLSRKADYVAKNPDLIESSG
ncbi:MAG: tyrosine-type recombinase/integrase [Deltaproteobacteria bacterium]|nr:tyrosine-type recombinase/integrase [Deltaproteobacteria bacterium]